MYNQIRNKRITFFTASLRGGGAERVVVTLIHYFARNGYAIDLVVAKKEGPYFSDLPSGINVIDLKSSRVFFSIIKLVRYLKLVKPDMLISTMAHVNLIALLARWLANVPTRVVIKEVTIVSKSSASSKNLRGRLMPLIIKFIYPRADLIIAVSKGVAEDLIRIIGRSLPNIKVIYDPVVSDDLLMKAEEEPNHPWLIGRTYAPVILAAGRLSKEKDYPTLIRAFNIISKSKPIRLIILGEGSERRNLEALICTLGLKDKVNLPGFVDNPFSYMKKASVFVLSSAWEGLSNVLIQAMAVGTPVVSTDCPSGPAEILVNGKYGPLVPVGDADALAAAILNVLNDPPAAKFLQERAQCFSVEKIGRQHFEEIIRGSNFG